ncbi:MAG: hypothetical protein JRH12_14770 [Deltaproteobacteria bacterium]|jgi:uncharacterized membrane protein YgcG|nr:hypothetical protein [Deltaproteobacteria bacterium]MBW2482908.1 hypothetical protein [Deltaproteobacteria bacterium]
MIGRSATEQIENETSVKQLLFIFFVCMAMAAGLGLSDLRADDDDPDDNNNGSEVVFQNDAQLQKADNVARQAALQDQEVNDLIELGRYRAAEALYLEKVETYERQITRMRAAGWGWGEIAHKLGVHPSFLGRGHTPITFEERVNQSKPSDITARPKKTPKHADVAYANGSYHPKSKGLAVGHSKNNSSNRGGGRAGSKGGDKGGGNGGGNGGGKK